MPTPIRFALAGVRRAGPYTEALRQYPDALLVALCDSNEEALAEAGNQLPDPQRFTVYETMLEQARPDAVIIATPMQFHADQSIAALQRDIHVLCEVTAAVSLDEARWLVQACRRSKACYMLAENCNYFKTTMLISAMVDAGLFGEVYYAEGDYLHNVRHLHHTAAGALEGALCTLQGIIDGERVGAFGEHIQPVADQLAACRLAR